MIFIYYCCNMQVLHKNAIWCWSQMQWKKEESWFILPYQHTICFWLQYYLKTEDNSASLDNMILIHKIFLITKRTRKKPWIINQHYFSKYEFSNENACIKLKVFFFNIKSSTSKSWPEIFFLHSIFQSNLHEMI